MTKHLCFLKQLQTPTNNLFKLKILQLRQPHYNLAKTTNILTGGYICDTKTDTTKQSIENHR